MDTPRQMSRADEKALLFGERYSNPHPSFPLKGSKMRFQNKMPAVGNPEWVDAHPQVWLAEVLERIAEKKTTASEALIVFDPGTAMEIHWRIKPRNKNLVEDIRATLLNHSSSSGHRTAQAIYDMLEGKGLL